MPVPVNININSETANLLIKKISAAAGILYEPHRIKKKAKAKADVAVIEAESKVKVSDIERIAMIRFVKEEGVRQSNMEQITSKALPLLKDNSKPDAIENDWITNFFDKCRITSDQEMQTLWAKVLSGEANAPGTYSKRTVNFISDLDKSEAQLFSQLYGYGWQIGNVIPLIDDVENEIFKKSAINFNTLSHLESIGLIQFEPLTGFKRLKLPKRISVLYYVEPFILTFPKDTDNELETGKIMLTKIGEELGPICGSNPVSGYKEYIIEKWKAKKYI